MRHRFVFGFPLMLLLALFVLVYFASQRYESFLSQR